MPDASQSTLELSRPQTEALDLSSNILLTAAAGSGKTTVLIERFLRILEHNDYRPEEIVAITFAEEAARQMRERIREAVERRTTQALHALATDPWARALRHLPRSPITTIHGFCHRLLRDPALNGHLDPELRLLDPARQQLLAAEAVRESLHDSSRRGDSRLKTLLHYLPPFRLEEFFGNLLGRRHHLFVEKEPDEDWLRNLYLEEAATVVLRIPAWDELLELLRSLPAALLNHPNSFSVRCRRQIELLQTRSTLAPRDFIESFELTLESRAVPTLRWRRHDSRPRIVSLWKKLKNLIEERTRLNHCTEEADRHFRQALRCVLELHAEIVQRYERKKRAAGGFDFDDLLVESARLVRKRQVAELLQERFRFFLIDEFQDTNELQWQVLRPLVDRSTNLLVVGDAKQSIYRFRNADVSVFRVIQDRIKRGGRIVEMPQNYRAAGELVRFCNHVFRTLFSGDLVYEASHQEMVEARPDSPSGRVESCFFEMLPEGHPAPGLEPGLVATAVQRLHLSGYPYSDVAILLRARTRLKSFEEALRLRGIPFQTVGGTGFYQCQEILDLLNLLRFLNRTSNDTALVGVLRSPIFSFSDEDLLTLSSNRGEGYWEKLGNSLSNGDGAPGHWRFARETLNSWLRRNPGMAVSALLHKVFQETGLLSILEVSGRGRQALQNVRKLVALVADLEASDGVYLRQVVRSLENLTRSDPNESEAEVISPGQDAVRICTIHGAKGLQFRAVVLPELGRRLADLRKDRFVAESFGSGSGRLGYLGFSIRNPSNRYRDLRHPAYQMLRRLCGLRQLAEEKRLLYVALTRAQDRLILIGQKTEEESYARWLLDAGAAEVAESSRELQSQAQDWPKGRPGRDSAPGGPSREMPSWKSCPAPVAETESGGNSAGSALRKRIWSPTELADFHLCPRRFLLGRLLAHPEVSPFNATGTDPVPLLFGEVVHDVIEKAENVADAEEVDAQLRRWAGTLRSRLEGSKTGFERRVRKHLKTVAENRIYHEMLRARPSYREREFRVRLDRRELAGVFDGLYKRANDEWVVVDFKTVEQGRRSATGMVSDRGFKLQVELYLWAAGRILGTTALKGFILFTSSGELVAVDWSPRLAESCEELIGNLPGAISEKAFPLTTRPALCRRCGFLQQGLCPGAGSGQ